MIKLDGVQYITRMRLVIQALSVYILCSLNLCSEGCCLIISPNNYLIRTDLLAWTIFFNAEHLARQYEINK